MADAIAKTQEMLGAVIPAPKLTEKLLGRPPFRFLHDIVTNFVKTNDFPAGYFTDAELDSSQVSSKEDKLAFITKLITVVEAAAGRPTSAKPAKILAGAEAENTNDMLQMLAECASLSPDQKSRAVRKALGGDDEPPAPAPAPAAAPAPAPAPEPAQPPTQVAPAEPPQQQEAPTQAAAAREVPQAQPLVPQTTTERPGTASSRKAPPKVHSNEVDHGVAETGPVAGVILEKKKGDDAEDEGQRDWMKIVEDQENAARGQASGDVEEAKGYLGRQALEAKRKQEEEAQQAAEAAAAAGKEGVIISGKRGGRGQQSGAMGETEMGKLREQLQMLTKASNPLGKFLEAIHEDMDTMSRELEMWKTEARTQATAAQEAQRQTEQSLAELNAQLQSTEAAIEDQLNKNTFARSAILQNDETIKTMLKMVVNADTKKK